MAHLRQKILLVETSLFGYSPLEIVSLTGSPSQHFELHPRVRGSREILFPQQHGGSRGFELLFGVTERSSDAGVRVVERCEIDRSAADRFAHLVSKLFEGSVATSGGRRMRRGAHARGGETLDGILLLTFALGDERR